LCVKHLLAQGDEVLGNETWPRPKEKIQRDRTADDSSLNGAPKELTGKVSDEY
jgi:hypothetical protein